MPWKERDLMSLRREFIILANQPESNVRDLCRRFEISAPTGYKWMDRYAVEGDEGLRDHSRRPKRSPARTLPELEEAVLSVRDAHPAWGGRKIRARMLALGHKRVPAASTITDILRRNGRLDPAESIKHTPWKRFEYDAPNQLWQMDFKGHFPMRDKRCHALTILDDHSRFSVGLYAYTDERTETVQGGLTGAFRRYGLPERILADNGPPWGGESDHGFTPLTVWLYRLGVEVIHGKPYHPQTQGKEERFHRTLTAEVLRHERFTDQQHCQRRFDRWRDIYNLDRPHEALDLEVPASRYKVSERRFPENLPPIDYPPGVEVRKVQAGGWLSLGGKEYKVPKAFRGQPVALTPGEVDGLMEVWFCNHIVAKIDLNSDGERT